MITELELEKFIKEAHRVGRAGLTLCSSGNLSWKIGDKVLISATSSWLPELSTDKVAICNLSDGAVLGGLKPSMESQFHLGVLRSRSDVNVVLHFQSPYLTALSCMKDIPNDFNVTAEIPCHVGAHIPRIPYLRPGSPELAEAVVEALTNHNSALLINHGAVVCGKDFNQAFERATFFEMACQIIVLSQGNYNTLSEEQIKDLEYYVLGKKSK